MNTSQLQTLQTEDKNIVLVDNTYFQNEAIEKFNFTNTRKNNKKQFFLLLLTIVITVTSFVGFNVYSNGFIDSPEIIVPASNISNEPIIIVAKSKPFFVKVGNDVIHSKLIDKNWTVDIGKRQGTINVLVGGMIDFGFTKLVSNSTKPYTFNRDYIAPKATSDLKSKYEIDNIKYSIILEKPKDSYVIKDNQNVIFDKNLSSNICNFEDKNTLKLICSMTLDRTKAENHQIIISDTYGNSSVVSDGIIQVVEVNNFDCNKDIIQDEGKIKCRGNKDSRITIAGISQDYKAATDFEAQTILDNGAKKVDINIVDKDDITKNIAYEVNIDKDKLKVDLSSTKYKDDCNIFICEGKIVKAISNKNVTFALSYSIRIRNTKTGEVKVDPTYRPEVLTSNIKANIDTKFFKHYNGYIDGPGAQYAVNDSVFNLTFTADNGKSVSFICNSKFICNER